MRRLYVFGKLLLPFVDLRGVVHALNFLLGVKKSPNYHPKFQKDIIKSEIKIYHKPDNRLGFIVITHIV